MLHEKEHLSRFLEDSVYRTKIILYFSVAVNALYIAIKLISGIYYRSGWLIVFALYYMVLTALRTTLVYYLHRHRIGEEPSAEFRRYRWIGILLLVMNLRFMLLLEPPGFPQIVITM